MSERVCAHGYPWNGVCVAASDDDHGPGLIEHLGCQDCMGTGLVPLNDPLLEDVIAQRDHAEALVHRYLTERDKALGVVEAVPSVDHLEQIILWLGWANDIGQRIEFPDNPTLTAKTREFTSGTGLEDSLRDLITALATFDAKPTDSEDGS